MKIQIALLVISASLAIVPSAAPKSLKPAASNAWPIYTNPRYGYQICYPPSLKPQREADNGDGRAFKAADGGHMLVFGANNVLDHTLSQEALEETSDYRGKRGKITYRAARDNWLVLSGDNGDGIAFYAKTFQRKDQFLTFQLRYPMTLSKRYKAIVERLSRCFFIASDPGF